MFVHWWGVIRHVYGRTIQRARYPSHNRKGWQAHSRGNQFAEYSIERRESLLNRTTGRFGYDTPDQAEKAGMLISKKWIDAAKPLKPWCSQRRTNVGFPTA